ncbi:MAG TPA: AAA family ATPase [Tepidisphaeraceae bacterium]|jgi:capsular exopolysaccharide synthesis family protein
MSNEIEIRRDNRLPAQADDIWSNPPAAAGEAQQAPFKKIHRLLRGRYLLTLTLALICGMGGAAAGYLSQKPTYRSDGLIEIKPVIENLGRVDIVMPMYKAFVLSQVAILKGQQVMQTAMESPEWKQLKRGATKEEKAQFIESLEVAYLTDSSLIRVTYTDTDQEAAPMAVKAIINAYMDKYAEKSRMANSKNLENLKDDITRLNSRLKQKKDEILNIGQEYGGNVATWHSNKLTNLAQRESEVQSAEIMLKAAQVAISGSKTKPAGAATTQPVLTDEQIAKNDTEMARLIQLRNNQQMNVDQMELSMGMNHPRVKTAREMLAMDEKKIKEYGEKFRAEFKGFQVGANGVSRMPLTQEDVEKMKADLEIKQQVYEKEKAACAELAKKLFQIAGLNNDIEEIDRRRIEYGAAIDKLEAELAQGGKVNVIEEYSTPVAPAFDKRKQFGLLGLFGGGALPIGLFLLIGLLDQRYRFSDDTGTNMGGVTLLGILPNLPDLLTDPDQAAIAAHCVHQIRTMLQINGSEDRRVFAVTSAAPGDGKTSLTLALGLSFAASGSRTLLIDCDLIGGGLTARLNMVSPDGVLEAISTHTLLEHVRTTDIPDLAMLPVGDAHAHHASSLSPQALRRLVNEARKHFDTVLIDTGPILGSIEASLVAAAADAVILTVARGQQRPLVEKALGHLKSIGARLAGVVFNRAQARDFDRSVNRLSMRSYDRTNGNGHNAVVKNGENQFGPVARAVASSFKPSNGNDHNS